MGFEVLELLLYCPVEFQGRLLALLACVAMVLSNHEDASPFRGRLQASAASILLAGSPSYLESPRTPKIVILCGLMVAGVFPCSASSVTAWIQDTSSITALTQVSGVTAEVLVSYVFLLFACILRACQPHHTV